MKRKSPQLITVCMAVLIAAPACGAPADQKGVSFDRAAGGAKFERHKHPSTIAEISDATVEFWHIKRNGYDIGIIIVDKLPFWSSKFEPSQAVTWIEKETGCSVPASMRVPARKMLIGDSVTVQLDCVS